MSAVPATSPAGAPGPLSGLTAAAMELAASVVSAIIRACRVALERLDAALGGRPAADAPHLIGAHAGSA